MPKRLVHARACAVLWVQRSCVFIHLSGDAFAKASDKLPSAAANSKAVMVENAVVMGAMVFFRARSDESVSFRKPALK